MFFSSFRSEKSVLTKRQVEVLRLLREGFSTKEVAYEMYLSVHTVNNHLQNIYERLGASNRAQAQKRAKDLGLLD